MRGRVLAITVLAFVVLGVAALRHRFEPSSDVAPDTALEPAPPEPSTTNGETPVAAIEAATPVPTTARVAIASPATRQPGTRAERIRVTSSAGFPLTWMYFVDDGGRVLETIRLDDDSTVELPERRPNVPHRIAAPGHAAVAFDESTPSIVLEPHTIIALTDVPAGARITTRAPDGADVTIDQPTKLCARRGPDRAEIAASPYLGGLSRIDIDVDLDDGWRASVTCPLRAGARHEFSLLHPPANVGAPLTIQVVDASGPVRDADVTVGLENTFAGRVYTSADDVHFALSPAAGPRRLERSNDAGIATFARIPFGSTFTAVARTSGGVSGKLDATAHDGACKTLRLESPPRLVGRLVAPPALLREQRAVLYVNWPYVIEAQSGDITLDHGFRFGADGSFDVHLLPTLHWFQTGHTFTVERIDVTGFESIEIARTFDEAGGDLGDLNLTPVQPFLVLEEFDLAAHEVSTNPGAEKCVIVHGDALDSRAMIFELRTLGPGVVAAYGQMSRTRDVARPYGGEHAVMHVHGAGTTLYLRRTERGTYALVPAQPFTLTLDAQPATTSTDELWITVRWPRADVRGDTIERVALRETELAREWTVAIPDGGRIVVERFPHRADPATTPPLASWTADLTASTVRLVVP